MAKQHAHCFVTVALVFLQSYFWDKRQIVKTESNYIDWKTVAEGVPPYGSILELLILFKYMQLILFHHDKCRHHFPISLIIVDFKKT